jgi:hypothetical protein
MLKIDDKDKFGEVITGAIAKVELTVNDAGIKKRWINAISKAVVQIEANGDFMTYDTAENHLVIWSQDSDKVYTSNGVCQCEAFNRGLPCFHLAAARLVRLYLELPENAEQQLPEPPLEMSAEVIDEDQMQITYLPNSKDPVKVETHGGVKLPVYN